MQAPAESAVELKREPPAGAAAQRERILAAMRRRQGTENPWIGGADFRDPVCDGHPAIPNITPRVSELRKTHEIVTERDPSTGCARYRLATDGGDSPPPFGEIVAAAREAGRRDDEQLALAITPASPPRSAIFDWDAAA